MKPKVFKLYLTTTTITRTRGERKKNSFFERNERQRRAEWRKERE